MKLKGWHKWLIGVGGSLVVMAVVVYFGMNMAVNYMLKSMVPSVAELSQQVGEGAGGGPSPDSKGSATVESGVKKSNAAGSSKMDPSAPVDNTSKAAGSSSSSTSATASGGTSETSAAPSDAQAGSGSNSQSTTPGDKSLGYDAQISLEKAKAVEESITTKEKTQITSLLLKKLSSSDINALMKMAGGGLTVEEKKAAKELIMQKLSEDEYNQLIGIAAKYGLSQGKSYSETSK